nr:gamma-glutamyl hydrolase 2-like [Nicotiana tomentosiformis]
MGTYFWISFFTTLIQLMATVKPQQLIESQLNLPSCPGPDPTLNYRPVIGIVSHPGDGASGRLNNGTDVSYIAASYVKFAEMAGARVIPLIYSEPPEILNQKLNLVNGVIFTGGRVKDGLYFEVVKGIFQKVLEKNDAGEHFPLLAICLGFELLTMIISKDNNILEEFSAANQASTVQFMENIKLERTVFGRFPPVLIKKMSTLCLVMQNHHFGISPERLQANKDLCSFFRILTTSTDKKNKVYVSTAQARRYPVTALQWHPEKNVFEWRSSQIPHTEDAIQVTQHVANYFVSEARKSSNKPAPSKLLDNLIYNYSPSFAGKAGGSFDEVYLFSPRPALSSL